MNADRTTLEGKDRAELTTIAEAMGATVRTRMKKAEIIDLIVGVAADDEPTSGGGSAAENNGDEAEGDAAEGAGDPGDDHEDADDDTTAKEKADDAGGDRTSQRGGKPGSGNEASETRHGSAPAEPEPGNRRRRRRRGRDRDELPWEGEPIAVEGFLDLRSDGYGFLRVNGGSPSREDCYVPVKMVREFGLRSGDQIRGTSRPAARNEKNPALMSVDAINERDPGEASSRPDFDDLVPVRPEAQLVLERTADELTPRVIDLVAPIGKGQRGLVVAPARAGKTTVVREIAQSLEANHPEVRRIVVLIDARPEEVTEVERELDASDVVASTFDRPTDEHIAVAEMAIERARRIVESGDDVCVLLDGLTPLTRAYNSSGRFTGRPVAGGIDAGALQPVKRLLGAARNVEDGGSLTLIATVADGADSVTDAAILEELASTANMALRLTWTAATRDLWPAVDIAASSTSAADRFVPSEALESMTAMRRTLVGDGDESASPAGPLTALLEGLAVAKDNAAWLKQVAKA